MAGLGLTPDLLITDLTPFLFLPGIPETDSPLSCSPYLRREHVLQAIGGSMECEATDQVDNKYTVRH